MMARPRTGRAVGSAAEVLELGADGGRVAGPGKAREAVLPTRMGREREARGMRGETQGGGSGQEHGVEIRDSDVDRLDRPVTDAASAVVGTGRGGHLRVRTGRIYLATVHILGDPGRLTEDGADPEESDQEQADEVSHG